MHDPEQEFEYELKCERIAGEIEMLILDGFIAALARLKYYLKQEDKQPKSPSEEGLPF